MPQRLLWVVIVGDVHAELAGFVYERGREWD
jgi:hypothetical protein